MFSITDPLVTNFIRATIQQPEWLSEIGEKARAQSIPVVPPETGQFLAFLVTLHRPLRILEIGTAIGYSTLWMAYAGGESCHITTIEQDQERIRVARQNFQQAGMQERIRLVEGDARNVFCGLQGEKFDLLFIDAAKGQYQRFLEASLPLLNDRALIVSDNVLFHGAFLQEEIPRRSRTMVKRLQEYIEWIHRHPQLQTVVLPLGDGVSLSIYTEKVNL